jgi:hypothetical protein
MRESGIARALVVVMLLSIALASTAVADDASFVYGGKTWHTFSADGIWYMASSSDTYQLWPGCISVAFDSDLTDAEVQSAVDSIPGLSILRGTHFNTYDLEFSPQEDPGRYVAAVGELSGVMEVVPDALCGARDAIPNDGDFDDQWAFYNTGQTGGTSDADIGVTVAWNSETAKQRLFCKLGSWVTRS